MESVVQTRRPLVKWIGRAFLATSVLLLIVTSLSYATQPDTLAAITIFPCWVWPVPGIILAVLALWAKRWGAVHVIIGWLLFLGAFAEEPRSLLRGLISSDQQWQEAQKKERAVRVVSLNCAGGASAAAKEVLAQQPDVVLLQEAPALAETKALAQALFGDEGEVVWQLNRAIIARGPIEQRPIPTWLRRFAVRAAVRLPSGRTAEVVSVHFLPPSVNMNLLSWSCWQAHADDRKQRREHVQLLIDELLTITNKAPVICGGDFNAVASDPALEGLRSVLRESFGLAGVGWGNTAINSFPFARIDHVWVDESLRPAQVRAERTKASDHRMVICDLIETP